MPRSNIAQLAIAQEADPGVAETLDANDVLTRLREGYTYEPEQALIDTEELTAVSSFEPEIAGAKTVRFGTSHIIRGPGDTTTDPAIKVLLEAAMLVGSEAYTIAFTGGAGTFLAGEPVTGSVSGGIGIVLTQTAVTPLAYLVVSGVIASGDTLTGGKSGATATASAGPQNVGYGFRPADSDTLVGHCVTVEGIRGGSTSGTSYYWQGRGCLADLNIAFSNGGPGIITQNFLGALSAQGNKAPYTVAAYPEASVAPPKFLSAGLVLGSYTPTGLMNVSISWPTGVTPLEDANSARDDGILFSDYRRERPSIRLEVDQVATGTYDYFAALQAGSTLRVEFTLGSTAGSIWGFAFPAAQFRSIEPGSREPARATFGVELGLTGEALNEMLIWQR